MPTPFQAAFLTEDAAGHDGLHLAVFGKHPAWNDHMQDFGLGTPTLSLLKQRLYIEGIGENLARGTWASTEAGETDLPFNHCFLWEREGRWLAGRIVQSSDGKGRALYPLVLAVQVSGGRSLQSLAPLLGKELTTLEYHLRHAESRDEVALAVSKADDRLHLLLDEVDAVEAEPASLGEARRRFAARIEALGGPRMLADVLESVRERPIASSFHLRIGEDARHAKADLANWRDWLRVGLPGSVPVLALHPETEPFIDLIMGEPSADHLKCLKLGLASMPVFRGLSSGDASAFSEKLRDFLHPSFSTTPPAAEASRRRGVARRFWRWKK